MMETIVVAEPISDLPSVQRGIEAAAARAVEGLWAEIGERVDRRNAELPDHTACYAVPLGGVQVQVVDGHVVVTGNWEVRKRFLGLGDDCE